MGGRVEAVAIGQVRQYIVLEAFLQGEELERVVAGMGEMAHEQRQAVGLPPDATIGRRGCTAISETVRGLMDQGADTDVVPRRTKKASSWAPRRTRAHRSSTSRSPGSSPTTSSPATCDCPSQPPHPNTC